MSAYQTAWPLMDRLTTLKCGRRKAIRRMILSSWTCVDPSPWYTAHQHQDPETVRSRAQCGALCLEVQRVPSPTSKGPQPLPYMSEIGASKRLKFAKVILRRSTAQPTGWRTRDCDIGNLRVLLIVVKTQKFVDLWFDHYLT